MKDAVQIFARVRLSKQKQERFTVHTEAGSIQQCSDGALVMVFDVDLLSRDIVEC